MLYPLSGSRQPARCTLHNSTLSAPSIKHTLTKRMQLFVKGIHFQALHALALLSSSPSSSALCCVVRALELSLRWFRQGVSTGGGLCCDPRKDLAWNLLLGLAISPRVVFAASRPEAPEAWKCPRQRGHFKAHFYSDPNVAGLPLLN